MQTEEIGADAEETGRCPTCRGRGTITCPADLHRTEIVADGGCAHCDSPGETPGGAMCHCQPE